MNGDMSQEAKDTIDALVAHQAFDQEFMSKVKVKTAYFLDYNAIEKLIDKYYGEPAGFKQKYCLPALEEKSQEDWGFDLEKEELDDEEDILPDENGGYQQWRTYAFMNDLCNRGIIPEGQYSVDISW